MKDFAYAILLNIAAAIIFWIVFALLPERRRRNKLRPKLEFGIYQVYKTLFTQFDTVMRPTLTPHPLFKRKSRAKHSTLTTLSWGFKTSA
jgi:hypothetical protein